MQSTLRRLPHHARKPILLRPQAARWVDRSRAFHAESIRQTDGVYKALTEMRVRTPWIEALRRSKETGSQSAAAPEDPPKPDLTPKSMSDSYVSVVLPLADDAWMLDTYLNYSGQLRTGALLMDLDALAGVVAYKHTGEGVSKNPLKEICNLELSGQVTYATGRSSMEVTLQIAKAPVRHNQHIEPEDVYLTCAMTMVSLDPATKRPVNIAPLKLSTPAERALYARGEENYKSKRALKSWNITQKAPDAAESELIHKMWTDGLAYADHKNPVTQPANSLAMSKTVIHSTQIMQPQNRNRHHFMIFGGYLLKIAFELAFTCAASFSHARPRFLNLDPSTFENPVPVGSVLYTAANVTFTEADPSGGTRIQVMVRTHVRNVEHSEQERKSTGTFFYTFLAPDVDVHILPQSYGEFMMWVGGRRRAQRLAKMLEAETKTGDSQVLGAASDANMTE